MKVYIRFAQGNEERIMRQNMEVNCKYLSEGKRLRMAGNGALILQDKDNDNIDDNQNADNQGNRDRQNQRPQGNERRQRGNRGGRRGGRFQDSAQLDCSELKIGQINVCGWTEGNAKLREAIV